MRSRRAWGGSLAVSVRARLRTHLAIRCPTSALSPTAIVMQTKKVVLARRFHLAPRWPLRGQRLRTCTGMWVKPSSVVDSARTVSTSARRRTGRNASSTRSLMRRVALASPQCTP
eukprot:Rmarinus@m.10487